MYFLVLDPDTSDPNPHAWEVNDAGPFETYGEACGFAQREEGGLQEEYETDDVSDWYRWQVVYVRPQDAERLWKKLEEISMKKAGCG